MELLNPYNFAIKLTCLITFLGDCGPEIKLTKVPPTKISHLPLPSSDGLTAKHLPSPCPKLFSKP